MGTLCKSYVYNAVTKFGSKAVSYDSKPMLHIGKQFGVSDNAIRKWCKKYGIESNPIVNSNVVRKSYIT